MLAMEGRNLELEGRRRPGAVRARKSACAPWRAAADLAQVGKLCECGRVAKRYEDDTVMGEGGD